MFCFDFTVNPFLAQMNKNNLGLFFTNFSYFLFFPFNSCCGISGLWRIYKSFKREFIFRSPNGFGIWYLYLLFGLNFMGTRSQHKEKKVSGVYWCLTVIFIY